MLGALLVECRSLQNQEGYLRFAAFKELWPQGSNDPNNRALGPKYSQDYSIWALKPCYLGPGALSVV